MQVQRYEYSVRGMEEVAIEIEHIAVIAAIIASKPNYMSGNCLSRPLNLLLRSTVSSAVFQSHAKEAVKAAERGDDNVMKGVYVITQLGERFNEIFKSLYRLAIILGK